ncbi:MAG: starch-binding protein, partial [Clostridia bacterium]|nr:starch-binding protein [Clostridia bacterium]
MKRKKYSRAASFLLAVIVCFCALLPASATLAETTGSTVNNAVSTGLTVHFKKPADWSSEVRIHYWNLTPSSIPNSGSWPGILMTPEADGWY